jgi:hypothetical protein
MKKACFPKGQQAVSLKSTCVSDQGKQQLLKQAALLLRQPGCPFREYPVSAITVR